MNEGWCDEGREWFISPEREWPLYVACTELWWWGWNVQSRDRWCDSIYDFVSKICKLIQTAWAGSGGQEHVDIARQTLQTVCGAGTFSWSLHRAVKALNLTAAVVCELPGIVKCFRAHLTSSLRGITPIGTVHPSATGVKILDPLNFSSLTPWPCLTSLAWSLDCSLKLVLALTYGLGKRTHTLTVPLNLGSKVGQSGASRGQINSACGFISCQSSTPPRSFLGPCNSESGIPANILVIHTSSRSLGQLILHPILGEQDLNLHQVQVFLC